MRTIKRNLKDREEGLELKRITILTDQFNLFIILMIFSSFLQRSNKKKNFQPHFYVDIFNSSHRVCVQAQLLLRLIGLFSFKCTLSIALKNEGVTTPWLLPYPVYLQVNKSRPPPRPHLSPVLTKHRRQSPAVCVFKHGLGLVHWRRQGCHSRPAPMCRPKGI